MPTLPSEVGCSAKLSDIRNLWQEDIRIFLLLLKIKLQGLNLSSCLKQINKQTKYKKQQFPRHLTTNDSDFWETRNKWGKPCDYPSLLPWENFQAVGQGKKFWVKELELRVEGTKWARVTKRKCCTDKEPQRSAEDPPLVFRRILLINEFMWRSSRGQEKNKKD